MAWSFVAAASAKQTTAAIDTTGANLIVLAVATDASGPTVSDSKGNTWTALTDHTVTGIASRLYYCVNPIVGSGHTFTTSVSYGAISATAYSGSDTSPFDQENGTATFSQISSLATGSITPGSNGELIIAALAVGKSATTLAINSSMSVDTFVNPVAGVSYGIGVASLVQTTAAAINPTWSWGGSTSEAAVSIASFRVASSGTTYTITPSGGVIFGGTSVDVKGKILTVAGGVSFSGTGSATFASGGTTYTITPTGGLTFAGSGLSVNSKVFLPSGGITFAGSGLSSRGKIVTPAGGVLFGGTGSMSSNTSIGAAQTGERTKVGVGT